MSNGHGSVDFLVSYAAEDRDWAEWIASHLGAMGYSYALQEPPSSTGVDPFAAAEAAVRNGGDVIVILSLALIEALLTSGARPQDRLPGPGRAITVQIEAVQPPPDLRGVPTAAMHQAADDYVASRDLLVAAVRAVRPSPSGEPDQRVPLPAPTALAESYPVPAPPPSGPYPSLLSSVSEDPSTEPGSLLSAPSATSRSAGLLVGGDREGRRSGADDQPPATPSDRDEGGTEENDERGAVEAPDAGVQPASDAGDATTTYAETTYAETTYAETTYAEQSEPDTAVEPVPQLAEPADTAVESAVGAPDEERHDGQIVRLTHPRPAIFWGRPGALYALAAGLSEHSSSSSSSSGMPQAGGAADAQTAEGSSPVVTLVGPTGSGKSALAAEHACRHLDIAQVIWWVRAGSRASLLADLRALGARLGLGGDTPEQQVAAVCDWFEHTDRRWLVIYDGVVAASDLTDVLPASGRGQLVITTANRGLEGAGIALEVGGFSLVEATSFLLTRTSRNDEKGASEVARRLGGSAAALELAGSYVTATEATFDAYLDLLDDTTSPPDLHAATPVASVEWCVLAALRAISDFRRTTAPVLATVGVGTTDVPLPPALVMAVGAPTGKPLVELLRSYGLVLTDADTVVIPSAVRQALAYLLPGGADADVWQKLISALDDELASADAAGVDALAPHAARLVRNADLEPSPVLARLAMVATNWTKEQGAVHEAVVLGECNVEIHARSLGEHDPATCEARQVLAALYIAVGDTPRAVVTQAAVLADCEQTFGPDDARTLEAAAALAGSYGDLGDHARAVSHGERALVGLEHLRGVDHPDTVALRSLLADNRAALAGVTLFAPAYRGDTATSPVTGRAPEDEAVEEGEQVGATEEASAEGAPGTVTEATDQLPPAEADQVPGWLIGESAPSAGAASDPLFAEAPETTGTPSAQSEVERLEAELGDIESRGAPDSLEAVTTRHQLAIAYGDAGEHVAAAALLSTVVAQCEDLLGASHVDTLTARANLASAYAEAGALEEAIACQERVVVDHEQLLGADDPQTLAARNSLANDYAAAGFTTRALELQQQIAADYERIHGPSDARTLTAQHNLANSHAELGNHQQALDLRLKVLQERERVLGADHPQTLGARNNLANSYADLGQHAEALQLRTEVTEARERVLGPDHPQTLGARNNLANSYADLGQHDQALQLRTEVLESRERVLGPDHPHTLTARNNLANSYAAKGQHEEALALRERALSDCQRVLGDGHPHTLTARNNLANTWAALGNEGRAREVRGSAGDAGGAQAESAYGGVRSALKRDISSRGSTPAGPGDRYDNPNGRDTQNGYETQNGHQVGNGHGNPVSTATGKPPRKRRFWFWAR